MSGYCHFNESSSSRKFSISLFGNDLYLRQNPEAGVLGHGAVVWDASVIFAKYIEHNPKEFDPSKLSKKTVLELGSGCGLAGLAMMIRGAEVTMTDMAKVVDALTMHNAQVTCLPLV